MTDELGKIRAELIVVNQHIAALRQATHEYLSDLAAEVERLKIQVSLIEPMTEEYKRKKEHATKKNQIFFNYN